MGSTRTSGSTGDRPTIPAREIVLDLLGGFVRHDTGRISMQAMAELMGAFGTSPDATRVVISRLRREGWVAVQREGRRSVITMTDQTSQLMRAGEGRLYRRDGDLWDGRWRMIIYTVPEARRATRIRIRRILDWHGFGPLATSTWICSHDRLDAALEEIGEEPELRLDPLVASSISAEHDRVMANRCWDLRRLNEEYAEFIDRYSRFDDAALADLSDQDSFALRVEVLYGYRNASFHDPDLHPRLLPNDWRGRIAHQLFLRVYGILEEPAAKYYQQAVTRYPT
ncbi:PaaX family transcriptional regulator [Pseudonocardia acaciae]|uniref:PaaX family transcriptional regulator n=1 Tax=Pseudonocardia acaciae TaxID=551276 RepID=UPI000490D580|nr:PaaX family transcriptional regulator C-terminal domain-containing protein [Pseudonocardia acaciae]